MRAGRRCTWPPPVATWTSPGEQARGLGNRWQRGPCWPPLTSPAPRYLLSHGANIAAVNSDGDLALDLAEADAMEGLLRAEITRRGGLLNLQLREQGPLLPLGRGA